MHAAGPGELLGHFDLIDEQSQWVRLFEAHSWTRCTLAMVTRQHVVKLAKSLDPSVLVELLQQMNTAWSSWLGAFASFLGLSFRDRLELVLRDLGTKFGIQDKEGVLLALDPAHADLAEMIGSSRPMVSRLMSELIAEGEIGQARQTLHPIKRWPSRGARQGPGAWQSSPSADKGQPPWQWTGDSSLRGSPGWPAGSGVGLPGRPTSVSLSAVNGSDARPSKAGPARPRDAFQAVNAGCQVAHASSYAEIGRPLSLTSKRSNSLLTSSGYTVTGVTVQLRNSRL